MSKKVSKIIIWALIIVFIGATVLGTIAQIIAGSSANTAYAAETSYKFSLKEAVDYAKQNNHDMVLLRLQNSGITYTLNENRSNVKKTRDGIDKAASAGYSTVTSSFEQYLFQSDYQGLSIKVNEETLKLTQSVQEELLDIFVESAYNTVLITKAKYEDAQRNYNLVKNQLDTGIKKLTLGNISEIEYKSIELEENNAEIELLNAQKAYDDAKIEFNEKLGLGIEVEVELTSPLVMTEKVIVETPEKNELIRKKSITLLSAERQVELAEAQLRYAKAFYGNSHVSTKKINVNLETTKLSLDQTKTDLEKSIKNTYKNVEIMKKTLTLMDKRVKLMESILGLTNIRKTAGMATENDVIEASLNYNSSKSDYYEMLNSYNIIVGMLDKNIIA